MLTLDEADDLIALAEERHLKFSIGYSQRFNAKQALIKRSLDDGSLGQPVSVLISRHITHAGWVTRSGRESNCHRLRWRRHTTSKSPCGASSRPVSSGCTRRQLMA